MNPFLQQCKDALERGGVNSSSKPILALSGGVDSSVLFHVLINLQISFAAAHVNYRLRETDSDEDEIFCRELCEKHGIPIHIFHASADLKNQSSIQEKAREIRYAFFESLMTQYHYTHLLTAHHADDSVETFFINLLRGSGMQGLKGIPELAGYKVRPLMAFTKAEISFFAAENHISYREDVSNQKEDYLRNRIRHHVIPALEVIENEAIKKISESLRKVATESDLLQFFVNECKESDSETLSKKQVLKLPEKLRPLLIFRFFQTTGINFSQAQILAGLLNAAPGKSILTARCKIWVEREQYVSEPIIPEVNSLIQLYEKVIRIPGYKTEIQSAEGFIIKPDPRMAFLDADSLQFPLIWRKWEPGDQMIPLGMKGKKNISDLLIDRKLENREKEKIHVLVSGKTIVWLEGIRIADSSKILGHTTRILAIVPENM